MDKEIKELSLGLIISPKDPMRHVIRVTVTQNGILNVVPFHNYDVLLIADRVLKELDRYGVTNKTKTLGLAWILMLLDLLKNDLLNSERRYDLNLLKPINLDQLEKITPQSTPMVFPLLLTGKERWGVRLTNMTTGETGVTGTEFAAFFKSFIDITQLPLEYTYFTGIFLSYWIKANDGSNAFVLKNVGFDKIELTKEISSYDQYIGLHSFDMFGSIPRYHGFF